MNYYNYYTEIEDTFIRRRGKHLFVSPLDWALIEMWQERGIPLHIVIRSIESVFDVFDKQPPGTRTIKTLFYCREEIEVQYAEWTKSRTGSSELSGESAAPASGFSVEAVAAHIDHAIAELKTNTINELLEDVTRAVDRLAELAANLTDSPETVDSTLADIEKLLERAMRSNWNSAASKGIGERSRGPAPSLQGRDGAGSL